MMTDAEREAALVRLNAITAITPDEMQTAKNYIIDAMTKLNVTNPMLQNIYRMLINLSDRVDALEHAAHAREIT